MLSDLPLPTIALLRQYATNAGSTGSESRRFRRIKLSNAVFSENVWCHAAAREALDGAGWRTDLKPGWIVLPDSVADCAELVAVCDALQHTAVPRAAEGVGAFPLLQQGEIFPLFLFLISSLLPP
jgi:hypothetical protein